MEDVETDAGDSVAGIRSSERDPVVSRDHPYRLLEVVIGADMGLGVRAVVAFFYDADGSEEVLGRVEPGNDALPGLDDLFARESARLAPEERPVVDLDSIVERGFDRVPVKGIDGVEQIEDRRFHGL